MSSSERPTRNTLPRKSMETTIPPAASQVTTQTQRFCATGATSQLSQRLPRRRRGRWPERCARTWLGRCSCVTGGAGSTGFPNRRPQATGRDRRRESRPATCSAACTASASGPLPSSDAMRAGASEPCVWASHPWSGLRPGGRRSLRQPACLGQAGPADEAQRRSGDANIRKEAASRGRRGAPASVNQCFPHTQSNVAGKAARASRADSAPVPRLVRVLH